MNLPTIPDVLADTEAAAQQRNIIGRRLGDVDLASLITLSAGDASIQTLVPEEIVNERDDNFY